uniref:Uncharacterized protein n=1 Tax=Romanomermis culicivorax TaxID=13658 RepID=A0A915ITH6_ROMCU
MIFGAEILYKLHKFTSLLNSDPTFDDFWAPLKILGNSATSLEFTSQLVRPLATRKANGSKTKIGCSRNGYS